MGEDAHDLELGPPAWAIAVACPLRMPWRVQCGRPAARHWSRYKLPSVSGLKACTHDDRIEVFLGAMQIMGRC